VFDPEYRQLPQHDAQLVFVQEVVFIEVLAVENERLDVLDFGQQAPQVVRIEVHQVVFALQFRLLLNRLGAHNLNQVQQARLDVDFGPRTFTLHVFIVAFVFDIVAPKRFETLQFRNKSLLV